MKLQQRVSIKNDLSIRRTIAPLQYAYISKPIIKEYSKNNKNTLMIVLLLWTVDKYDKTKNWWKDYTIQHKRMKLNSESKRILNPWSISIIFLHCVVFFRGGYTALFYWFCFFFILLDNCFSGEFNNCPKFSTPLIVWWHSIFSANDVNKNWFFLINCFLLIFAILMKLTDFIECPNSW